jgi:hypothetical protein
MNDLNAAMFEGFVEAPTETKAVVVGFRELPKAKTVPQPMKQEPLQQREKKPFTPRPLTVKLFSLHENKEKLRRPCEKAIRIISPQGEVYFVRTGKVIEPT